MAKRRGPAERDQTLGEAMRERREQLGWSQGQAAEVIGCSQPNYNRIENDLQDVGAELYEALCNYLDVDFRDLAYLIATSKVWRLGSRRRRP